ncbi:uncharacterized protein LOC135502285 [Lineus longissimus]|uniref:uncharacterized protein LOC135502285 n=1 Tax=Lineus longissimus TaxID=88925 RepID=UPI002B4F57D4
MLINQMKSRWFFAAVVFLFLAEVYVLGAVTFLSTPSGKAIYGQNIAFKCNDSGASAPCTNNPSLPECTSTDKKYNQISYTHTLANGTVLEFGTCSNHLPVSDWNVTWSLCDKVSSSLTIINVSLDDAGKWKCISGGVTEILSIDVQYPPMLNYENSFNSPPPPTLDINLGSNFAFNIMVKANPGVTNYTATCLRANVASRLKLRETTTGKEYLLSLQAMEYTDFGNHTCQIKNSIGTLLLQYLLIPRGPTFTLSKGRVTAVSATLEWLPQNGGPYTPSYIIYYKQSNQTTWIPSNENKPLAQPTVLKAEYKQGNLMPDSLYDFKVTLAIEAIHQMDAAISNILRRVQTYSRPNITSGNIRVTTNTESGVTYMAWDKFTGHYTHMKVKYCLLDASGNVGTCDMQTVGDRRQLKIKLDLTYGRSYSFYFYVMDGDDVVFESAALVAKSTIDINGGVKLSGAEIGGIVVGIIAACLVLTAVIIVVVRVMRKKREERLKMQTHHSESTRVRGGRQGVRFNDTGHDNATMIPDPYYQVPVNRRAAKDNTPSSTLECEGSGVYETVEDDGSRFYEAPLPSPPTKPYDSNIYTSLKADRIYLNVPPPKSGLASVGQASPKLDKQPRIYENLPPPNDNKKARPPDVSTINHIYVNTGFSAGSGHVQDDGRSDENIDERF